MEMALAKEQQTYSATINKNGKAMAQTPFFNLKIKTEMISKGFHQVVNISEQDNNIYTVYLHVFWGEMENDKILPTL